MEGCLVVHTQHVNGRMDMCTLVTSCNTCTDIRTSIRMYSHNIMCTPSVYCVCITYAPSTKECSPLHHPLPMLGILSVHVYDGYVLLYVQCTVHAYVQVLLHSCVLHMCVCVACVCVRACVCVCVCVCVPCRQGCITR